MDKISGKYLIELMVSILLATILITAIWRGLIVSHRKLIVAENYFIADQLMANLRAQLWANYQHGNFSLTGWQKIIAEQLPHGKLIVNDSNCATNIKLTWQQPLQLSRLFSYESTIFLCHSPY